MPAIERRPIPASREPGQPDAERLERARKTWTTSIPIPGTPAAAYLAGRFLPDLARCPALRWHPSAGHPSRVRHPAMVALVQDAAGVPIGIHRTHLTPAGEPARHLSPGKSSLGPIAGGAVRLQPSAPELVVGEGIETSASAGLIVGLPAWAGLSTSGLLALQLPDEVRAVVIAADNDVNGAGQRAADGAAGRWTAEGRRVRIITPDQPGQDFADLYAARQRWSS